MLRRSIYVGLALVTIGAGLAFRSFSGNLPHALRDVTGDALWAAMLFWWVSAAAPAVRLRSRIAVALLICTAVELAQLYRSPLLTSIRSTTVGHLVLGSDFDARDLAAYAFGVIAASVVDALLTRFDRGKSASRSGDLTDLRDLPSPGE